MGNVKYSKVLKTSNGNIKLSNENKWTYEDVEINNGEYLKIHKVLGKLKVYINNATDYIYLESNEELELKDIQINSLKVISEDIGGTSFKYYILK